MSYSIWTSLDSEDNCDTRSQEEEQATAIVLSDVLTCSESSNVSFKPYLQTYETIENDFYIENMIESKQDQQSECSPNLIPAPKIEPPSKNLIFDYVIGDPELQITLKESWQSKTACCALTPQKPAVTSPDRSFVPYGLFSYSPDFMTVKIQSYDGRPTGPGGETYFVTIMPEQGGCLSPAESLEYKIRFYSPCPQSTIILGNQIYRDEQMTIGWNVSSSVTNQLTCGITQELYDVSSGSLQALESDKFIFNVLGNNAVVIAGGLSPSKIYTLHLHAYLTYYPEVSSEKRFTVQDNSACIMEYNNLRELPMQQYFIGSRVQQVDLKQIIKDKLSSYCVQFEYQVEWVDRDEPFIVEQDTVPFSFDSQFGVLQVYTDEISLLGLHKLEIQAVIPEQQNIQLSSLQLEKKALEFSFERCPVKVSEPWELEDIVVPQYTSSIAADSNKQLYEITEPAFTYIDEDSARFASCNYYWERISVTFVPQNFQYAFFDNDSRIITAMQIPDLETSLVVDAQVTAQLSDQLTKIMKKISIHYDIETEYSKVQPPQFRQKPQETYEVFQNSTIQQIKLGPIDYQFEDQIEQKFECQLGCKNLQYDDGSNTILIPADIPIDVYPIAITLSDRESVENTKTYNFKLNVTVENIDQEITYSFSPVQDEQISEQPITERESPTFTLTHLKSNGELTVVFSQKLETPVNLDEIDEEVIAINVKQGQSGVISDEAGFDLSWSVSSFEQSHMKIKINFENPLKISSGEERDLVVMRVKDPIFFFSKETYRTIAENETSEITAPKMMHSENFQEVFDGMTGSASDVTKVSLVASFAVNMAISGPLYLLWGLINSLQIVTHYPLINVMMPSNAYQLMLIIYEISDFQIIPVEQMIEDFENGLGIQNDGLAISDNFVDFELDSTDVIRNLQIVFLFLLGLIILPVFLLLFFYLFYWSNKCKKWVQIVARGLFWNTYIRFGLESYLEFCLASFIRLRQFKFYSSSETFNSLLALIIHLTLLTLLIGSIPVLHCKPLKKESTSAKYRELTLGLKTHQRLALCYPTLFMLRRMMYTFIIVFWFEDTVEQVLVVLVINALQTCYIAHCRQNQLPLTNRVDLMNEVTIMLCTYCMMTFTGLVTSPEARYQMGWVFIVLVLGLMIGFNLVIVLRASLQNFIKWLRLRVTKRRKQKLYDESKSMKSLIKLQLNKMNKLKQLKEKFHEESKNQLLPPILKKRSPIKFDEKVGFELIDCSLSQIADKNPLSPGSQQMSNMRSSAKQSQQSCFRPDSMQSSLPLISLNKQQKGLKQIATTTHKIMLAQKFEAAIYATNKILPYSYGVTTQGSQVDTERNSFEHIGEDSACMNQSENKDFFMQSDRINEDSIDLNENFVPSTRRNLEARDLRIDTADENAQRMPQKFASDPNMLVKPKVAKKRNLPKTFLQAQKLLHGQSRKHVSNFDN